MHCFICVTYMIILSSAHPAKDRTVTTQHEKRSLFRDVIESLRIHAQLPEEINQNDENNISQNYDRYGYESDRSQLSSDGEFVPRRNDRIEMPQLKYRFSRSIDFSKEAKAGSFIPKKEVIVYMPVTDIKTPNNQKQNFNKMGTRNKTKDAQDSQSEEYVGLKNSMTGQSQIGNRESQTVVNPTVVVNIRNSVDPGEGENILEKGIAPSVSRVGAPQNVFNINQEIKLDRGVSMLGSEGGHNSEKTQELKVNKETGEVVDEVKMSVTGTKFNDYNQEPRKLGSVMEILFVI